MTPAPAAAAPRSRLLQRLRAVLTEHPLAAAATSVAALLFVLARCVSSPVPQRRGQEIEVCGQWFPAGTPVVLWHDPAGYDAYRRERWFTKDEVPDGKLRYSPLRGNLPDAIRRRLGDGPLDLPALQQCVHQFVLHYDMAGTARQCFKVLQDVRALSVHFLLDVDGTIYQTLDLREKAHHATIANDFSIGVEIAHPGAWSQPRHPDLLRWYERDELGWRMKFPGFLGETGVRTAGFVPRPARPEPIEGLAQGRRYWQFDYTPEQYAALARLCAALHRVFPRIRLEAPRDPDGNVRTTALPPDELRAFDGIVGHLHVQTNKQDPGPAMRWDWLLAEARRLADR